MLLVSTVRLATIRAMKCRRLVVLTILLAVVVPRQAAAQRVEINAARSRGHFTDFIAATPESSVAAASAAQP